jgi:hypothetical protein
MEMEQHNRIYSKRFINLPTLKVIVAAICTLVPSLTSAAEVSMKFIVNNMTLFDVREKGETAVYSPRTSGISVTPVLVNECDHSVTLVTRGVMTVVRGRNVAYIWRILSCEGAVVLESPSEFGLVTLKKGQMTSLEAFILKPEEAKGAEFVVDYSVGDELRSEMEYWVGTVTGRIKFRDDATVAK